MSIWTSNPAAPLGLSWCLALAGCAGGADRPAVLPGFLAASGDTARVVALVDATGARFAAAAPSGFCPAPGTVAQVGGSDFVAFARCPGASGAQALLTAMIAPDTGLVPADLDATALAAFFTSEEGRSLISRAGRADSVTVHEVLAADDAVLVRLTDSARPPSAALAVEGESWRAVTALAGRLVTLTASGATGAALTRDSGRRMIAGFLRAMRKANSASVRPADG